MLVYTKAAGMQERAISFISASVTASMTADETLAALLLCLGKARTEITRLNIGKGPPAVRAAHNTLAAQYLQEAREMLASLVAVTTSAVETASRALAVAEAAVDAPAPQNVAA